MLQLLIFGCLAAIYWFVVRERTTSDAGRWPLFVRFVPLLIAAAILAVYFVTNSGAISFSSTEYTYGAFVLVLLPLAGLLFVLQVAVWYRIARRRDRRPRDPPGGGDG